jgi:two-component system OmpR family response regulator
VFIAFAPPARASTPPAAARILLVGAERAKRCRLGEALEPRGYRLEHGPVPAGRDLGALDLVLFARPAAEAEAVIDQCRSLRDAGPAIIVLHSGAEVAYAVRALEAGADDCLLAPHNPREVVARVRAVLRRRERNPSRYGGRHLVFDGCVFDAIHRRIEAPDGRAVELTQGQHRLLAALLARPGEVVSREELLGAVLGEETDSFDRAIDVHVSRLKKRLAQVTDADLIKSYRGVGYRMDVRQIVQ